MKQLIYLATPTREHRFDALFNELDIVVVFHDITQIKSLVAFVVKEKTVVQQDCILLDLETAEYSQEHILSAVQSLRRFSPAQILFIAPSGEETDLLFGKLASFRVSGLMEDGSDALSALRDCLLGEQPYRRRLEALQTGMVAEARQIVSPLRIPPGLVISVAVAGVMPRIGVTTQVFALYHYLKGLGFSPAVADSNHELAPLLAGFYPEEAAQKEGCTTVKGIPFCDGLREEFNAYLMDMGVLTPETAAQFCAQDVSILVGGTKPWELPHLAAALSWLNSPRQQITLLSFATGRDVEEVSKHLGPHSAAVPYHPDIWTAGSTAAYGAALLPCLRCVCGGSV